MMLEELHMEIKTIRHSEGGLLFFEKMGWIKLANFQYGSRMGDPKSVA